MADINKITKILSKVLAIICVAGAVGMLILGIVCFVITDLPKGMITDRTLVNTCGMVISAVGLPADKAPYIMGTAYVVSAIIYGLLAMIFRNVNLIVETAEGGTWFSKGKTPFQDDNIRMVREIGIFCIAIFFIGWIGTIIATLIYDNVETGNSLFVLIIGIIVICLSKMFEYGKELQDAEDGLI